MHLGYALNIALREANTRYVAIIDGDFFITRTNWIEDVISHMKARNLALLGTPWHPRWFKKARYFPTLHGLFIDASQIPPPSLDFRPQYESPDEMPGKREPGGKPSIYEVLKNDIAMRTTIGTSKDCAYALYKRYEKSRFNYENFIPVYKPYAEDGAFERTVKLAIDIVLPDRYSFTPRRDSYTTKSFKERGAFDAMQYGWEEFVWKDAPFSFHMRNTGNSGRNKNKDLKIVTSALQSFSAK
jgi:glycosyltransferase involved in cell wall biosynthesis